MRKRGPAATKQSRPSRRGRHEYLAERVYRELRNLIVAGDLSPGERLKEEALCSRLKVSRSIVRQVLVQLTAEGLLEDQPKKGKSVVQFTEEALAKLLPIRIALETLAVREAIVHIAAEDEVQLKTFAAKLQEPNLNPTEQDALDVALHRKIWHMAKNDELERLLSRVVGPFHMMGNAILLSPYYRRSAMGISLQRLLYERECSPAGHQLLVEAICSRDAVRATQAMEQHLTYNWSSSKSDFEQEVGKLMRKYLHSPLAAPATSTPV